MNLEFDVRLRCDGLRIIRSCNYRFISMLNSPQNSIFRDVNEHEEFIAPGSSLRLWWIGAVFTVAAAVVGGRVAWVQTRLPDAYLESLTARTVEEEIIPARDGRILADSLVMAADLEQYEVQIHYRWLQKDVDSNWLKLQLRQKLSAEERRDAELVAATEREIQGARETAMESLSEATQVSSDELAARCERIEQRVRKISDSVNDRILGKSDPDEDSEDDDREDSLLIRWMSSLRESLTTAPRREDSPRIVVREEESWHTVLENVPARVAAEISEHPERFPGIRITGSTQRTYPENDLAVHVVGARTKPTATDQESEEGPVTPEIASARIGRFGVEKSYNHRLAGVPGLRRTVRDRRQRIVSSEVVRRPVSGRDVILTLDVELQKIAEQLLAESLGDAERSLLLPPVDENPDADQEIAELPEPEHIPTGGCILVMEADSGRIVAAASAPKFDLALFTEGTQTQWEAINSDTRRPFISRFTGMALPPGSTFKIVTAIAGLQTGELSPETRFECQGFLSQPNEHRCLLFRLHGRGHGPVDLRGAMAQSCNVYFFDAARRMGVTQLVHWADLLQFGRETGIDLPFEKSGNVPTMQLTGSGAVGASSDATRRRFEREALGLSIGQSRLTVTPVQMARLLAFVANGGWLVTPHVVSDEGLARQAGEMDDSPFQVVRRRISGVTEETLSAVRDGLQAVVEDPIGTGFKTVRLPGIHMAGKTGTAETSPGKPDHAWFTGYAPAENPKYVFVVALEHGGSGSKAAGPIARELVRSMMQRNLLGNTKVTRIP
jgi:penicillin-binding protein 2